MTRMKKPTVLSSEIVHQNPWYHVRHDKLVWPNGKPGQYFVATWPGAVCVICVADDKVLTVRQYRHPIGRETIEFPMGGLKDGDPLFTAKEELREETGHTAETWHALGVQSVLNGAGHMHMHIFAAEGLVRGDTALEDGESGLTWAWLPIDEWRAMIRDGRVEDAESIAAWALYREWKGI